MLRFDGTQEYYRHAIAGEWDCLALTHQNTCIPFVTVNVQTPHAMRQTYNDFHAFFRLCLKNEKVEVLEKILAEYTDFRAHYHDKIIFNLNPLSDTEYNLNALVDAENKECLLRIAMDVGNFKLFKRVNEYFNCSSQLYLGFFSGIKKNAQLEIASYLLKYISYDTFLVERSLRVESEIKKLFESVDTLFAWVAETKNHYSLEELIVRGVNLLQKIQYSDEAFPLNILQIHIKNAVSQREEIDETPSPLLEQIVMMKTKLIQQGILAQLIADKFSDDETLLHFYLGRKPVDLKVFQLLLQLAPFDSNCFSVCAEEENYKQCFIDFINARNSKNQTALYLCLKLPIFKTHCITDLEKAIQDFPQALLAVGAILQESDLDLWKENQNAFGYFYYLQKLFVRAFVNKNEAAILKFQNLILHAITIHTVIYFYALFKDVLLNPQHEIFQKIYQTLFSIPKKNILYRQGRFAMAQMIWQQQVAVDEHAKLIESSGNSLSLGLDVTIPMPTATRFIILRLLIEAGEVKGASELRKLFTCQTKHLAEKILHTPQPAIDLYNVDGVLQLLALTEKLLQHALDFNPAPSSNGLFASSSKRKLTDATETNPKLKVAKK